MLVTYQVKDQQFFSAYSNANLELFFRGTYLTVRIGWKKLESSKNFMLIMQCLDISGREDSEACCLDWLKMDTDKCK